MAIEYKEIVTPSFPVFCLELAEALRQGFMIEANNLPHASFTYYETTLVRDVEGDLEEFPKQAVVFPEQAAVKRVGRPVKAV